MSTKEKTKTEPVDRNEELFLLEQRKVKALERIAASIDSLTIWFEEIDKLEWSDRIQFYLSEFHKTLKSDKEDK